MLDFVLFVKARGDQSGKSTVKTSIRHTPGVCGGEACLGNSRIAVWMLEEARRAGVNYAGLLLDYPSLTARDPAEAWTYVEENSAEIENAIRISHEA
ncbi:MAG TPA: DUF433 domain-containing protein [Prosthecobacter sp.]